MNFTRAIARTPGANFAEGLTTAHLGTPNFERAIAQHEQYVEALKTCGLQVTLLRADMRYPDSTFVEDTAILIPQGAIITNPGAETRAGEVHSMRGTVMAFFPDMAEIVPPGTLDGGDICEAGTHFFIGISRRTNAEGARQLAEWLAGKGYTSSMVNVPEASGILHLKSGIAYIGDNRLIVIDSLADHPAFSGYELIRVSSTEEYAANCVRINDHILLAARFPQLESTLRQLGYSLIVLDMSEFQKMDGGLSCLSLRF